MFQPFSFFSTVALRNADFGHDAGSGFNPGGRWCLEGLQLIVFKGWFTIFPRNRSATQRVFPSEARYLLTCELNLNYCAAWGSYALGTERFLECHYLEKSA